MRLVAVDTGIFDDRVNILHHLQLGLVVVATIAKVIAGGEELILDVTGVNIVTGLAVVHGRRMLDLLRRLGLVTLGAEEETALGEQSLLRRGVRGMAAQTVPLLDRGMDRTLPLALALVTLFAQGRSRRLQQPLRARSVRGVTGNAVAIADRRMDDGENLPLAVLALVVVALLTECRPRRHRQLRRLAGMGIMAGETVALSHRRMNDFGIFHQSIVALLAKSSAAGKEEFGIIAGMRRMTGRTPLVGDDRVNTLHPLGRIVVTTGAEVAPRGDEEFAIFTPVRIMATKATILQGGMDHLLPLAHAVMTLLAEGGATGGEAESPLLAGVGDAAGFVAGRTIAAGHRVMQLHPFRRRQRRVTLGGHATLGSGQGECRHDQ